MTTTPATPSTPALDRFFATLGRSSVIRSQNRVIAGVCSGIAERLGVSAAIVRVAAVALALLGPGVLLYLVAWLMLPKYDGTIRLERAIRQGEASSIVLLVLTALAFVPDVFGHAHLGPWPFIGLGILAIVGFKKGWFGNHRHVHGSEWGRATAAAEEPTSEQPTPEGPQDAPKA